MASWHEYQFEKSQEPVHVARNVFYGTLPETVPEGVPGAKPIVFSYATPAQVKQGT